MQLFLLAQCSQLKGAGTGGNNYFWEGNKILFFEAYFVINNFSQVIFHEESYWKMFLFRMGRGTGWYV